MIFTWLLEADTLEDDVPFDLSLRQHMLNAAKPCLLVFLKVLRF